MIILSSLIQEHLKIQQTYLQLLLDKDSKDFSGFLTVLIQVMMFSSTNCVYCDVAKETFTSMGTQFKSLEVRMGMLFDWNDEKHEQCKHFK